MALLSLVGAEAWLYVTFRPAQPPVSLGDMAGLSLEEATEYIHTKKDLLIVDVRGHGEFASGHQEGAINIPLRSLFREADSIATGRPVLLHCQTGMRSVQAYKLLKRIRPDLEELYYVKTDVSFLPRF